jgi:hemerythrin
VLIRIKELDLQRNLSDDPIYDEFLYDLMSIMKWSDNLSVQIQEIDQQHQKLIQLINNLHEAMLQKQGKQAVEKTIDELAAYTVYHFSTEEKYMQNFRYPGYLSHKKEHDSFVHQVDVFQKDYMAGKLGLSLEIMNFLRDWVTNHIQVSDKKYSETFIKNGIN